MFREFYEWYTKKLRKSPLIVIAGSLVALFAAVGSIYSGVHAISDFSNFIKSHYFENQFLYEKLEKINTGLNIDFIETIIEKPAIVKKLPSQLTDYVKTEKGDWIENNTPSGLENYTERIYIHKKYFIQLIINNDGIIVSYAVTIRDSEFNPKIPIEIYHGDKEGKIYPYIFNLRLGKAKLTDIKDYEPEEINISNWGMNYFYIESHYFGNPGFYKHYLLALSPSGCCIGENIGYKLVELGDEEDKSIKNNKIAEFRKVITPNTFAVINGWENENLLKYFIKEGVGPNYYDIREF